MPLVNNIIQKFTEHIISLFITSHTPYCHDERMAWIVDTCVNWNKVVQIFTRMLRAHYIARVHLQCTCTWEKIVISTVIHVPTNIVFVSDSCFVKWRLPLDVVHHHTITRRTNAWAELQRPVTPLPDLDYAVVKVMVQDLRHALTQ